MIKLTSRLFLGGVLFLGLALIPAKAFAATLYLSPAKATVNVGDRVTLKVLVAGNSSMNGVAATFTLPPNFLAIESVSKSGSVLNFWATEPTFSKTTGQVKFEGVSLSGFQNNGAVALTITARALKEGTANANFQTGQVLANDGAGTDITSGFGGASIVIKKVATVTPPPVVTVAPVVTTTTPVTAPTIPVGAEVIDLSTKIPDIHAGLQDGRLAILGTSEYPKTEVKVSFISVDGAKVYVTGLTNTQGDFIIMVPQSLRNGAYAVNAVLGVESGNRSIASNILAIEVGQSIYVNLTWEMAAYLAMAATTILLLILLCVILFRRRQTV